MIEQLGGQIEVQSVPGQGTQFHLEIPLSKKAATILK